jgi:hypothetical protein
MSTVTWPDGETRTWSGTSKCLCWACRQLFGGVTGFERHQRRGKCLDPATVGLVLREGVWIRPLEHGLFTDGKALKGTSKESSGH